MKGNKHKDIGNALYLRLDFVGLLCNLTLLFSLCRKEGLVNVHYEKEGIFENSIDIDKDNLWTCSVKEKEKEKQSQHQPFGQIT